MISISYHFDPDYVDPSITPVVQRGCAEFGKLSLTGITFVASSGDGGVAYSQAEECLVDGELEFFVEEGSFVGQFPASCPYVTAVGATSVAPGNTVRLRLPSTPHNRPIRTFSCAIALQVKDPEIATTAFPSGGGFSNNFPRPAWQSTAVNNYLKKFAPAYGPDIFNRSGRAYPDVAANGYAKRLRLTCTGNILTEYKHSFPTVIAIDGGFVLTGGTSASAPIFASIVTAINDARLAIGKRPVGWLNPAVCVQRSLMTPVLSDCAIMNLAQLYSPFLAHAFNDVTNGTNPGCGTEGFPAAPGWDPITGLGTPNFPKLLAAFLLLP